MTVFLLIDMKLWTGSKIRKSYDLLLYPQVYLKFNYTIHANASKHRDEHSNNSITVMHRRLNVNHANYSYFDDHGPYNDCM